MADLIRAVFITIGNLHFGTPIMADYIALHEETAWQADYASAARSQGKLLASIKLIL